MKIFDLHQDLSVRLLQGGMESFLSPSSGQPTYGKYNLLNQIDLPRLIKGEYKVIVGACCALNLNKQGISIPNNPLKELNKHLGSIEKLIKLSENRLILIQNSKDLNLLRNNQIGILMAVEGLYCIKNNKDIELVDHLIAKGVRIIAPFWNLPNTIQNKQRSGLSPLGKRLIRYLNKKKVIIDCSHAPSECLNEMIELVNTPMISHTLNYESYPHFRNINKDIAKKIAAKNGIIGICFIKEFTGGDNFRLLVNHILDLLKYSSEDTIALGSDFGAMLSNQQLTDLSSAEQIQSLVSHLKKAGFSGNLIGKICWKNAYTFLQKNL